MAPEFEFDPTKSDANRQKHGIDFEQAPVLWSDDRLIEVEARTEGEPRFLVVARLGLAHWSAIITYRAGRTRIISVRRSRPEEIALYEDPDL